MSRYTNDYYLFINHGMDLSPCRADRTEESSNEAKSDILKSLEIDGATYYSDMEREKEKRKRAGDLAHASHDDYIDGDGGDDDDDDDARSRRERVGKDYLQAEIDYHKGLETVRAFHLEKRHTSAYGKGKHL